jgi:phospholipid transport system transporter-binding protein
VNDVCASDGASAGAFAASADLSRWTFDGDLTFDNAAAALEAASALDLPKSGRIDLSGLGTADSSALAVVFALKRRAKAERRELVFEGIPPGLASLARVYGVDGML